MINFGDAVRCRSDIVIKVRFIYTLIHSRSSNVLAKLSILSLLLIDAALTDALHLLQALEHNSVGLVRGLDLEQLKIGRASCRERV